eukprot:4967726-Prorocentrum_lima.AAC.1
MSKAKDIKQKPISGPLKANVVQSVEEHMNWNEMKKDHIMVAMVKFAPKRVDPYASTRFNIIPYESQE